MGYNLGKPTFRLAHQGRTADQPLGTLPGTGSLKELPWSSPDCVACSAKMSYTCHIHVHSAQWQQERHHRALCIQARHGKRCQAGDRPHEPLQKLVDFILRKLLLQVPYDSEAFLPGISDPELNSERPCEEYTRTRRRLKSAC